MKLKIIFIICIVFLLNSCGDSGTNTNDSNKELWPFSVGNTWTYFVYSYHRYNSDTVKPFDTITYYISGKKSINGEDWYFMTSIGRSSKVIFINRSDGLWGYNFKDSTNINIDSATLGFRYPTYLNETYPNDTNGIKTVSLNSEVISPAGKFTCIKYIYIKRPQEAMYFYPGIGLIKNELITAIDTTLTPPDTVWIRMILVSYILFPKE
ncbi:MAG: hypothetical protein A2X61_05005 [Ignavibacteria bacterium GWB2_35_12]|nr:MAG: hypothetical protein A2X63_11145 [Ignavibacteria bacterium GWA2_35_8]OGU41303.1 MAG: hypothetical protein A2X61_05005 [Ignavibacteria bacterium GWB2_35_12]OGU94611.1 MAG: hypothetical protein A2220_04175 [Ignavibacteria bacterium RIFOXYA2_FULL_35_10]OGV23948.1 MAG: hypothetical protein A2475_02795 [Ignavibacteria bacterium RIFOXYC2_FULL_35_21]